MTVVSVRNVPCGKRPRQADAQRISERLPLRPVPSGLTAFDLMPIAALRIDLNQFVPSPGAAGNCDARAPGL
jgi:hypothetical protein